MKRKKKVCTYCKKPYKREAETVSLFGSTFCLHDDQLDHYKTVRGMPMRSNPALSVEEAKWGHNSAEKKYIDKAHRAGDAVVRGSDGLLRRIGKK